MEEEDRLALEEEVLKIVERRTAICRRMLEIINRDEEAGAISHEEAVAMIKEVKEELYITEGMLNRQKARLQASKKEEKDRK